MGERQESWLDRAMPHQLRACGPCLILLLLPLRAVATLGPTIELPTHEISALLPARVSTTPGAGAVLFHEDLARWRPTTAHEAFAFIPGLRTIDDDAAARRSGIGIRGAPSRRSRKVLLLEDGAPINAAAYLDPSAHYTPPLDRVDRIEVLKGAGHLRYGPLNNHGIVNFRNLRPSEEPETIVRIAAGTRNASRFHARHSFTAGTWGVVAAYTGERADGTFDLEHMRYDDFHLAGEWAGTEHSEWRASLTYFRERSHYDESNLTPEEFFVAPRRKRGRFGQEHNVFGLDVWRLGIAHARRFGSGGALTTKLFASDFDRPRLAVEAGESPIDLLPVLAPDEPFDPAGGTGHMVGRLRLYRTFGLESVFSSADGGREGVGRSWQAGVRAERQFLDDRRSTGAAGEVLTVQRPGPITREEIYQASAASAFAEQTWRTGAWTWRAGARVEHYTQAKERRAIARDPGPHPARQTDENTIILPSLSALFAGWRETEVFANVGRGFSPAIARTAAGFPLRPEASVNTQLGFRTRAVAGLALEGAVFANFIDDTVVHLPFTVADQNVFLNSEDSRAHGAELALRFVSEAVGVRPVLELAYGYTEAWFTGGLVAGRYVPEVPRHAGSLSVGIEHAGRWHASVTASHLGGFFTDPANRVPLTLADEDGVLLGSGDSFEVREPIVLGRVPAHTVLSARVGLSWRGGRMRVWLQGRNLTDRLYIADLENGVRPGPARTVLFGVEMLH